MGPYRTGNNKLATLDEVEIPVDEEFIWLYFVDNLPPGYKNNLKGPLTCAVLEDAINRFKISCNSFC